MKQRGYYGDFGGAFVPEILMATFDELEAAYEDARADPSFWGAYEDLMSTYSCRPTPITFAENLTEHFGGAQIYVKREDLNHTGAHKANNVLGQGLLVKRMGKKRVIAETGAGQHGVATATMAAKFGFECTIYMGEVDVERQRPNVFWMERLGAKVVAGHRRFAHLERRHQRGLSRLGHQHGLHALRARHGVRAASVPQHGDLLPVDRGQRGAESRSSSGPANSPSGSTLAWVAGPTRSGCSAASWMTPG